MQHKGGASSSLFLSLARSLALRMRAPSSTHLLQQHLGRHVEGRAGRVPQLLARPHAAQAKVDHLQGRFRGLVRLEKVIRLDVSVQHIVAVALAHQPDDVLEVDPNVGLAQVRVGLGVGDEVAPRAVLHHHVHGPVVLIRVLEMDDVQVVPQSHHDLCEDGGREGGRESGRARGFELPHTHTQDSNSPISRSRACPCLLLFSMSFLIRLTAKTSGSAGSNGTLRMAKKTDPKAPRPSMRTVLNSASYPRLKLNLTS
mmetsp:Transcript_6374/g.21906  ORF Transcript_6374/g.21906 Transcript_6374/m.21906 type:complete len:256 (-) Transcript_6374:408-1175(-)